MFDVYKFSLGNENLLVSTGIFCVTSLLHRQIKDPWLRKWYLTIQGFVCISLLLRFHVWEYISVSIATSALIKISGPRYCHVITLVVLLASLSYYRFFYREDQTYINVLLDFVYMKLIAVMSGVAFDIHNAYEEKKASNKNVTTLYPMDDYLTNPSFWDLMHLNMFLLTIIGSYHRYRTYDDFIRLPFARHAKLTKKIFWKIISLIVTYFAYNQLHGKYFPQEFLLSKDFKSSSMLYQVFYSMTQNHAFRLHLVYFMISMEISYSIIGFGAYPVQGENISGHGPTKNYRAMSLMSEEECANAEYDFNTVKFIDVFKVYTSPWLLELVKYWNMTVQYWLSSTVYKSFYKYPKYKLFGMFVTAIVSHIWHGYEFGFFVSQIILVQHALASKYLYEIYKTHTKGLMSVLVMIISKILQEIALGFGISASLLIFYDNTMYFLNSTYWVPIISVIAFNVMGYMAITYLNMKNKKKRIAE